MSVIKIGLKNTISDVPLYKTTTVQSENDYRNFKIYTAKINSFFSAGEVTSYIFQDHNYKIFSFDHAAHIKYHFESLCLFYKDILGVIEHPIKENLKIITFIIDCDGQAKREYNTLKLLYSYALTFYATVPDAIVIASEVVPGVFIPELEFYYERFKELNYDVTLHHVLKYYQIIYTTDTQTAQECMEEYDKLKANHQIVFPMKYIIPYEATFGFYLQATGWKITYKDNNWVAVNKGDILSLDREFIVMSDAIIVTSTTPINALTILNDAIYHSESFHFKIKIYYNSLQDIYCLTRAVFETGAYNMNLQVSNGMITIMVNYFNYDILLKLMDNIKNKLKTVPTEPKKWRIVDYSEFTPYINTEDLVESLYTLKCIYGEDYALYDSYDGKTRLIFNEAISKPSEIPDKLNIETPVIPDLNEDDYEPITTDKYSELSPLQKHLLVKLNNRYYLLNSLILLIENEISTNRNHPRDPGNRSILSRNDIMFLYQEYNRIIGVDRPLKNFVYPDLNLTVERDREWTRIYLIHDDCEYDILYLPVFLNESTPLLLQPIQRIIDLVKEFFKLNILISHFFSLDYSINNKIMLDPGSDVLMYVGNKDIWPSGEQERVEIYNELCRSLAVYF